jgi:FkbM family methyltransferase
LYDALLYFFNKRKIRGRSRLYGFLTSIGFRAQIIVRAKYQIKLLLNPGEYIDKIIMREDFYESEITEEILRHLKDGDTFWDIGANIGIHSLAIKKKLPKVKVFCFEPGPKALTTLQQNIQLNDVDIHVCAFALFDRTGSFDLHLVEGNTGMSTLVPWDSPDYKTSIRCLATTVDQLITEGFEVPKVIKLDTEGSELHVLKGATSILCNPALEAILFEAGTEILNTPMTHELVLFLVESGFHNIRPLERREQTHHTLGNFVALR